MQAFFWLECAKILQKEAAEDGNESPSVPSQKKKRGRPKKEADVDDDDDDTEPALKKAKAAPKKGKKVKVEDDSEGQGQAKQSRRKAIKPKVEHDSNQAIKTEENDEDNLAAAPTKKQRAPRKAALKKPEANGSGEDVPKVEADLGDETMEVKDEERSKVKKSRKPARTKETKSKSVQSQSVAKPKQKVIPFIHFQVNPVDKPP